MHTQKTIQSYQYSPAMKRLLIEKMKDYRNHRIINPPALHPCGDHNKRMMVTEHKVAVPLYHADLEQASTSITSSITPIDSVDSRYDTNESFDGWKLADQKAGS